MMKNSLENTGFLLVHLMTIDALTLLPYNDTELKSRSSQWDFEVCPSQARSDSITNLDRISFPALTLESITMKVF